MLKIFKSNNPLVIIVLLVYFIILKLALVIFPFEIPTFDNAPLTDLTYFIINRFISPDYFFHIILAGTAIFIQALMINKIADDFELLQKRTYLPALAYILLTSLFKEFHWLSPTLLSAFFIIPAIYKVFSVYKKESANLEIFDAALLISIASLFYFPAALLFIWIFIGIGSLKSFNIQEWIITLIAFVIPYFLAFTWYFWFDQTDILVAHITSFMESYSLHIYVDGYFLAKILVLVTISAWFLLSVMQFTIGGAIQIRKYVIQIIILIFISLLTLLFQPAVYLHHFLLALIPLAIVFAINFNNRETRELMEIPHLLLVITILITQYLNFAIFKNIF